MKPMAWLEQMTIYAEYRYGIILEHLGRTESSGIARQRRMGIESHFVILPFSNKCSSESFMLKNWNCVLERNVFHDGHKQMHILLKNLKRFFKK